MRVELTDSELSKVRREEPALILPLARDSKARRIQAQPLSGFIAQTLSLDTRKRRYRSLGGPPAPFCETLWQSHLLLLAMRKIAYEKSCP